MNSNGNRHKSITETHFSKSNCKVSSISANQMECLTSNNMDMIVAKDMTEHQEQNLDNKRIDTNNPESGTKDKVVLNYID